jgi:hypothetical protein
VYGRLAALASVERVVVCFRYLDAEGNTIHARTRRLARVQRFVTYPIEDEVFDSRTAERIAGYRVVLYWSDGQGGYHRVEAN